MSSLVCPRMPCQTIQSRIKVERLEVWHTGVTLPIITVEVTLPTHIIQAWNLNCLLGVTETIEQMNSLITKTRYETIMVEWTTNHGILNPNPEVPLVGRSWWEGFKRRNQ